MLLDLEAPIEFGAYFDVWARGVAGPVGVLAKVFDVLVEEAEFPMPAELSVPGGGI
jgi:hypothetical protein